MNIRPLNDKLLVERIKVAEKIGALFIPGAAKGKSERAKVLAVGPGKFLENGEPRLVDVRVGQVVLLSKWPGGEVKLKDSGEAEHLIISEDEVLAVEEGDPEAEWRKGPTGF